MFDIPPKQHPLSVPYTGTSHGGHPKPLSLKLIGMLSRRARYVTAERTAVSPILILATPPGFKKLSPIPRVQLHSFLFAHLGDFMDPTGRHALIIARFFITQLLAR